MGTTNNPNYAPKGAHLKVALATVLPEAHAAVLRALARAVQGCPLVEVEMGDAGRHASHKSSVSGICTEGIANDRQSPYHLAFTLPNPLFQCIHMPIPERGDAPLLATSG